VRALAVLFGLLIACAHGPDDTAVISLTHAFTPLPARVGQVQVMLTLHEGTRAVEGARLALEGNMSHPGMVPVQAALRPAGHGAYEGVLELTMAGDWLVRVWGKLADGRPIDRTIALRGVLPAH
jgi:hypothetical protein